LGDELLVQADPGGRLGLVIVEDELDLPPQHPAFLVHVLGAELVAPLLVLAKGGVGPGK
jgi:hypothetical protein